MRIRNQIDFDPGTGAKFSHKTKRVINKDGSFNVRRFGVKFKPGDGYLVFINMSWLGFIAVIISGFILLNIGFATVYIWCGDEALSSLPGTGQLDKFLHAFYFSTQTFTTVGYGAIAPQSHLASMVASLEDFVGFMSFSLATGLLYGRFSRANAKIRFSEQALIQEVNGQRSLLFRIANERPNQLMEMEAMVMLTTTQTATDGSINRTYHRLKLQIDKIEFFPLNWTIVHPIDSESQLNTITDQEIQHSNGELLIQ